MPWSLEKEQALRELCDRGMLYADALTFLSSLDEDVMEAAISKLEEERSAQETR